VERTEALANTMTAMAELARWLHRIRSQPATPGLSILEASALYYISEGATRPSLLAERLYIGPATATTLINRLAVRGLVSRDTVDGQKRAVSLGLTPAGQETSVRGAHGMLERAEQLFADWSHSELGAFQAFIARVSSQPIA
jgi:DNA-binding MarR family transcriptional regulator